MIRREMMHFVHMRHQFLISKSHSRLAQARTVLITSVPDELATEPDLRQFASFVPGGVDKVRIFRDTKALNELFEERQEACAKLEVAESEILHQATKAWHLKETVHKKAKQIRKTTDEEKQETDGLVLPPASRALLDELVPPTSRPRHNTGFVGLFGPKVDTIDWYKVNFYYLGDEMWQLKYQTRTKL